MSIRYYDESLFNKINNWVKDPNVRILNVDESTRFFTMRSDLTDDRPIDLPLIVLSRDPGIEILNPYKKPLTYDAAKFDYNQQINKTQLLNAIPIKLGYQLDIYTRYFEQADEYARNFIFNFINYPTLEINIPYNNANTKHKSMVNIEPQYSDNSDIPERLISGQFRRMTIRLIIDDAYLFSSPVLDNTIIADDSVTLNLN